MPNLSTKERKAKLNTDDLIFRKESSLPSGTLLSLSSYIDIEYNSAKSLTNKYKLIGTKSKINEIKNKTKRKLNMLNDEINDILQKLDVNLTTLELRCIFCEKPYEFKNERELRL